MKKIILSCLIIMMCFLLTGCGGEGIGKVNYKVFDDVTETKEDNGKLETGNKWESKRYVAKGLVLTVTKYEDRDLSLGIAKSEGIEKKKINSRTFYYKETKIDDEFVLNQYYTQVGKDAYLFAFTYKDSKDNAEKVSAVLESVEAKK